MTQATNARQIEIKRALAAKYLHMAVGAGGTKKKAVLIRRAERFRRQAEVLAMKSA